MPCIAILGGAHIHTPGFARALGQAEDVETRYVWDPDPATAMARAESAGGRVLDEPNTALSDPEVDGVVICSQTNRHEELVTAAAGAGKAMFVEKPLGFGAEDAYRMAEAIERAGVTFQTGFFQRGGPAVRWVREAMAEARFGRVHRLRIANAHNGAHRGILDGEWEWMADPALAGMGGHGDMGSHALDLLLWLMADDPVEACTGALGTPYARYGDVDEFGEALIRFQSGAVGTVLGGWSEHANRAPLEVSGTGGHAHLIRDELYTAGPTLGDNDGHPRDDLPSAWPHAFQLFLQALRGADAPLVQAREAAYRNAVIDAVYEGARAGTWVAPCG
jgi:predicted dehydrogenase